MGRALDGEGGMPAPEASARAGLAGAEVAKVKSPCRSPLHLLCTIKTTKSNVTESYAELFTTTDDAPREMPNGPRYL